MHRKQVPVHHVHIGSGALGLGLICWATQRLGFEVTILNRSSSLSNQRNISLKDHREYLVESSKGIIDKVPIADFLFIPNDVSKAKEIISDNDTVLITTAIKEYGIKESSDIIRDLFKSRLSEHCKKPLLFIACENAINSNDAFNLIIKGLPELEKKEVAKKIIPINCVVDRICNKPFIHNDCVNVITENFAEWYIESSVHSEDVFRKYVFRKNNLIRLVDNIEPYVYRKKWVVNALHLSAAVSAFYYGYILIDAYLKDGDFGRIYFNELAKEIKKMFMYWNKNNGGQRYFTDFVISQFFETTVVRIATHPQLVSDATTRLKKDKIVEFMKDFYRKIVAPYLIYTRNTGEPLYYVPEIISMIYELIANDRYVD